MIKRKSWQDYQKEIADDHYYYARSCIRQNFFPGSEKLFIDMLRNDLGKDLTDDPLHSSCTGIGYHSDIVPLETIMTVVARQFALMTEAGYENLVSSCITSFGVYTEILVKNGINSLNRYMFTRPRGANSKSLRVWPTRRTSSSTSASRSPHGPNTGWSMPRRANR